MLAHFERKSPLGFKKVLRNQASVIIRPVKFIENENENKNATGEDTYAGALRTPRAGSSACVFAFLSVLMYV